VAVIENTQLGFNFLLAVEIYRKMGSTVTSFPKLEESQDWSLTESKKEKGNVVFVLPKVKWTVSLVF
jgi:hypothetical protein